MTSIRRQDVSRLSGYAPALPTPFNEADEVDAAALERLCDRQIQEGASALVVCGTTGEAPNLNRAEHDTIVRIAVNAARGRIPVIAGAGSNSTSQAIELSRDAEAAGADAILSVVPYYNKPTQAGMYAHFRAVAESTGLPLILYDVPSRTVCGLADDTIARLAELPQIIGLKDATGDVTRPLRLRSLLGPEFRLLSGDDATALAFLLHGGDGCISVTFERGARPVPGHVPGIAARPTGPGPAAGDAGGDVDRRAVLRKQSSAGQVRTELVEHDVAARAIAARRIEGGEQGPDRYGHGAAARRTSRPYPRRR